MTINGVTDRSFRFLAELEEHNSAAWFHEHKAVFSESLQDPFALVLEEISARLAGTGVVLQGSRATMFRMNRDVRFSKDKRPYKTSVSGLLTPSGTKSEAGGLVYVQLGADGGFVAAGLHSPPTQRLGPVREAILADPEAFEEVVRALADADLHLDADAALKSMPRGFAEHAEHRLAWALRLTTLTTQRALPKSAWKSGDVVDRVVEVALAAAPLLAFVATGG